MTESEIPQSNALAEATTDSLAELMSRDPEGYTRQDRGRIIEALRSMRVKWEQAEAAKPAKGPRGQGAGAGAGARLSTKASANAEDLGL